MIEHIKYVMEKAKEEQPFPWQFMGYREDLVDANENFIIEGEVWGEWASEIIENAPEWLGYLIGEVERLQHERDNALSLRNVSVKHFNSINDQNKELQKALEWYADEENYNLENHAWLPISADEGKRARQTLKEISYD